MIFVLSQSNAIGGYFELELPVGSGSLYPEAIKYQSARSAFYAVLDHCKPKRVWVPYYICDTMLAPLEQLGVETVFYSLNRDFTIAENIELAPSDKLLYVNYFGLCSNYQDELLQRFSPNQVIFDNSQAFFCSPKPCLATLYSPRKFFGVPDGGLLVTRLAMDGPESIDDASIDRSLHLLKRLAGDPEDGYEDYQRAEQSLQDIEPKRMSFLTESLLLSIDYQAIKRARENNFRALHKQLGSKNSLKIEVEKLSGPMLYPFIPAENAKELKRDLIQKRCFVATYWSECLTRLDGFDNEKYLVESLVALPCDQRVEAVTQRLIDMVIL